MLNAIIISFDFPIYNPNKDFMLPYINWYNVTGLNCKRQRERQTDRDRDKGRDREKERKRVTERE